MRPFELKIFMIAFVVETYLCKRQENLLKPYPPDNVVDFSDLVLNYEYFVDKTLLIKDFLLGSPIVLVTRPRGWGKTMNLNMLKRFFQLELDEYGNPVPKNSNRILFAGGCFDTSDNKTTRCLKPLKIMRNHPELVEKHQGKYPVIYLNANEFLQPLYYDVIRKIDEATKRIFHTQFGFLKKYYTGSAKLKGCDVEELRMYMQRPYTKRDNIGIKYLIQALAAHFNTTVFVFVDQYDYTFQRSMHQYSFYVLMRRLYREVFDDIFKQTENMRGMIVGVTTAPKVELSRQLRLNYMVEDTLLETWNAGHFGFTEDETAALLSTAPFRVKVVDFEHWYKGYSVADKIVYHPLAVLGYLNNAGQLASYGTAKAPMNVLDVLLSVERIPKAELSTTYPNLRKPLSQHPYYEIEKEYDQQYYTFLLDEWSAMMYSNTYIMVKNPNQASYDGIRNRERSSFYGYFLSQGYFTATHMYDTNYNVSIPNYQMRWFLYETIVRSWLKKKLNQGINTWIPHDWELGFSSALANSRMERLEDEINKALSIPERLAGNFEDKENKQIYNSLMTLLILPLSSYNVINRYYSIEDKRVDFVVIPATVDESKQNCIIIRYTTVKGAKTFPSKSKSVLDKIYYNSTYRDDVRSNKYVKNIYTIGIVFHKDKASVEYRIDPNT